jgi:hypothetical protein
MDNDALSLLMRQIAEDRAAITNTVTDGVVADFGAFQELRGQIRGLTRAHLRVEEMRARLQRESDS